MPRKPNMTVTARYLDELLPLARKQIPSPYPNPPAGRGAIARLSFHGPTPKLDTSPTELVHRFAVAALPDAVLFLDTNILTRDLDQSIWDAFRSKHIVLTSSVFSELTPWLTSPFCNQAMRNDVVSEITKYTEAVRAGDGGQQGPTIEVLLSDQTDACLELGYTYYFNLLALRKAMGPLSRAALTKKLGRIPTNNELTGYLQSQFGPRGLLLARKGLDGLKPPNGFTDENLVVSAVLTAIRRGVEVFIVTRDRDVLEQYFKLLCLMKEHYRAMLIAERYAADPASVAFQKTPILSDGVHVPEFTDESVMRLITTDDEFHPLPARFHFVNIYCALLGGDSSNLKVTWCNFCAETEMVQMLKMKARTQGLSTDKFDGRNCTIRTEPLAPDHHRVIVSIGHEPIKEFGPFGKISLSDMNNALFENEETTKLFYPAQAAAKI